MPKLIPLPQAAKLLGMTRANLWQKVRFGQVKAERLGRNFFIPQAELVRLLNSRKGKETDGR